MNIRIIISILFTTFSFFSSSGAMEVIPAETDPSHFLNIFPDELCIKIFSYLCEPTLIQEDGYKDSYNIGIIKSRRNIVNAMKVNKKFYRLLNDEKLTCDFMKQLSANPRGNAVLLNTFASRKWLKQQILYDCEKFAILQQACAVGATPIVRDLLPQLNPNACGERMFGPNLTPLMIACQHRQEKVIDILLQDSRVNVNFKTTKGWTATTLLINNIPLLKKLIKDPRLDKKSARNDIAEGFFNKKHPKYILLMNLFDEEPTLNNPEVKQ